MEFYYQHFPQTLAALLQLRLPEQAQELPEFLPNMHDGSFHRDPLWMPVEDRTPIATFEMDESFVIEQHDVDDPLPLTAHERGTSGLNTAFKSTLNRIIRHCISLIRRQNGVQGLFVPGN